MASRKPPTGQVQDLWAFPAQHTVAGDDLKLVRVVKRARHRRSSEHKSKALAEFDYEASRRSRIALDRDAERWPICGPNKDCGVGALPHHPERRSVQQIVENSVDEVTGHPRPQSHHHYRDRADAHRAHRRTDLRRPRIAAAAGMSRFASVIYRSVIAVTVPCTQVGKSAVALRPAPTAICTERAMTSTLYRPGTTENRYRPPDRILADVTRIGPENSRTVTTEGGF